MASYIDNINENAAVVSPQPFVPDWAFLEKTQKTLTALSDAGFQSFKSQYSPLLNSDLTASDNIAFRDEYKKKADQVIDRITGMDLSDPRNLSSAKGVLKPLLENQNFIHDIGFTRQAKEAIMEGSRFQNAADPAMRKMYNPYSIKDIQYAMQDYSEADPSSRLGFNAPGYTPGVDMFSLAQKYFEEAGYEVWTPSIQNAGNGMVYNIRTKNGEPIRQDVQELLMRKFQNDPLVQRNLQLKNKVELRDYVETNLDAFGGDKLAASIDYVQKRFNEYSDQGKEVLLQNNSSLNAIMYAKGLIEKNPETNNKERLSVYDEVMSKYSGAQQNSGVPSDYKLPANPTMDDVEQALSLFRQIDFSKEISSISGLFSRMDMDVEIKADPYAMEEFKLKRKFIYESQLAKLKASLEAAQAAAAVRPNSNQPVQLGIDAQSREGATKRSVVKDNQKVYNDATVDAARTGAEFLMTWSALDGNVIIKDDNGNVVTDIEGIMKLSPERFDEYILQAEQALNTFSYDYENDPKVRELVVQSKGLLNNYNRKSETAISLYEVEKANLLDALTRYNPSGGANETVTRDIIKYLIQEEGIIDEDQLEQSFIELFNNENSDKLNGVLKKIGISAGFDMPGFNTQELIRDIAAGKPMFTNIADFIVDGISDRPRARFREVYGGFDILSPFDTGDPFGESNTIRSKYYEDGVSLKGLTLGMKTAEGGRSLYGNNLGYASNNRPNNVNQVLLEGQKAIFNNGAVAKVGDLKQTISGEAGDIDAGEYVYNDLIRFMTTATTDSKEQLVPTMMYEDPDGRQFINVRLPDLFVTELEGSNSTPGYARDQAKNLRQSGLTLVIDPNSAIPETLFGSTVTPEETLLNVRGGSYTFGGKALDGGKVTLMKSPTGLRAVGTIYEYNPETGTYYEKRIGNKITENIQARGLGVTESFKYIEDVLASMQQNNLNLELGQ